VQEAQDILVALPAFGPCKSLFLKDKKNNLYLVVALFTTTVLLKALARMFASTDLHFAREEKLNEVLGVLPGSVTPFGLLNDAKHSVIVLLDKAILQHNLIGVHPLRNDATTLIAPNDLVKFIESCGNRLEWFT
jgi:Ala-tRNA(Pro) deacylase